MTCTQQQAEMWFVHRHTFCRGCRECLGEGASDAGEFDALVDFIFNLGAGNFRSSTMLKLLNAGNYHAAAGEFEKWDRCGGVELAGLLRRRQAEEAEFYLALPRPRLTIHLSVSATGLHLPQDSLPGLRHGPSLAIWSSSLTGSDSPLSGRRASPSVGMPEFGVPACHRPC